MMMSTLKMEFQAAKAVQNNYMSNLLLTLFEKIDTVSLSVVPTEAEVAQGVALALADVEMKLARLAGSLDCRLAIVKFQKATLERYQKS